MATGRGKLEPDDYMIDFYPMDYESGDNDYDSSTLRYMKMGQVYDQSRRSDFELRVKKWLKQYIKKHLSGEAVVLAVAPGHEKYDNSSFMYDLVREFMSDNRKLHIEDGCSLLVRYKTIEKQSQAGANRSESTHRRSIRINIDIDEEDAEEEEDIIAQLNEDKVVIILDDVWTSGCTLRACEDKVWTTGPKDVRLLAIGKTV